MLKYKKIGILEEGQLFRRSLGSRHSSGSGSWSSLGRYTVEVVFIMADLFLSLGAKVSEPLSLKLPPNVVEESARASFSVLGESSALRDYRGLVYCIRQYLLFFP